MNTATHLPIIVIIIPLLTAVLIPLLARLRASLAWYATLVATFLTFYYSLTLAYSVMESGTISYWLGGWEPPWGIEYVVDSLSVFVLTVVSFIAFIVSIYAPKSVAAEIGEEKAPLFYSVYMLFLTGIMGVAITGDVFNLYVFIEITSLASYTLIAMGRTRDALVASFNYLIFGTIAGTFILIGVGYLYVVTGTLNMADLSVRLPELYSSTAVRTAFAFFTVGLSLKIALFPFHVWLPRAYNHAPSVVSAVVAATSTKVGVYVLIRLMFTVFSLEFIVDVIPVTKILIVLASVAIMAGSILAISQTKMKRMLAYSSVGQMGYIVLGAAIANHSSIVGSLMHILNHALMKGGLFLCVGAIIYKTGIEDIKQLGGLAKKMPFTMAAFTIGSLSMIGVPLTVGAVSKWYISIGAFRAGMWYLIPIILVSSMLTAVYFWRIVENIYFGKINGEGDLPVGVNDAPFTMLLPIVVLAVLCVVFGVVTFIPLELADMAATLLVGEGGGR